MDMSTTYSAQKRLPRRFALLAHRFFWGERGKKRGIRGVKKVTKGDNLAIFHVIRSWNEPNLQLLTGVNDGLGSGGKKKDCINGIK